VDNSAGLMRSDGTVNVQAGAVRNDSTQGQNQGIEGATVSVSAADISNRQGAMRGDAITLTAGTRIDNNAGLISATNSASLMDANPASRALVIDNSNGTVIAGQQTSVLAYSFTGSGRFLSQKDLRIDLVAWASAAGRFRRFIGVKPCKCSPSSRRVQPSPLLVWRQSLRCLLMLLAPPWI
ncbi:hypothetical protein, partial [Herbaspirillum huttiense]